MSYATKFNLKLSSHRSNNKLFYHANCMNTKNYPAGAKRYSALSITGLIVTKVKPGAAPRSIIPISYREWRRIWCAMVKLKRWTIDHRMLDGDWLKVDGRCLNMIDTFSLCDT